MGEVGFWIATYPGKERILIISPNIALENTAMTNRIANIGVVVLKPPKKRARGTVIPIMMPELFRILFMKLILLGDICPFV